MPSNRTPSMGRIAGLAVAAAALLVSAAACGSDSEPATGGAAGTGGGGFTAYTDCLKENGVTVTLPSGMPRTRPSDLPSGMPRPSGSARPGGAPGGGFPGGGGFQKPAGVDDTTWQKAQSACASLRPSGRPGGNGRGSGMSAAYRTCLQDHGVTLGEGGLATSDPKVQQAMETCKALAPTASPAPSS